MKTTRRFARLKYLTPLTRRPPLTILSPAGPSPLIHCHQFLWMKTSPLPLLMTKLNWCGGTTIWATSLSKSRSSLPSMARYPRNCQSSSPPGALAVHLAQWPSYLGATKSWLSSHKVFIATKLGETVSVNQMELTEVGFFTQLKGSLTKNVERPQWEIQLIKHSLELCASIVLLFLDGCSEWYVSVVFLTSQVLGNWIA